MEYAVYLGIDVQTEGHLLWIAEEGLRAPLPPGFTEHVDADGTPFFCDAATQESSWEHPLDRHYRDLIAQHRAAAGGGAPSASAAPPDSGPRPPPSRSGRRSTVSPAPPGGSGPAPPPAVVIAAAGREEDAMRQTISMRPRR